MNIHNFSKGLTPQKKILVPTKDNSFQVRSKQARMTCTSISHEFQSLISEQ